jgi:hypothetical protein
MLSGAVGSITHAYITIDGDLFRTTIDKPIAIGINHCALPLPFVTHLY